MSAINFNFQTDPKPFHQFDESDDNESEMDCDVQSTACDAQSENEMESDAIASTSNSNPEQNCVPNPKKSTNTNEFVEIEYEMLVGDKSDSLLLSTKYDHHFFTKHTKHTHGIRYRCRERTCRAFVILNTETNTCMRMVGSPVHKHKESEQKLETKYWNAIAMNEMRKQCANLAILAGGKRFANVKSIFTNIKAQ